MDESKNINTAIERLSKKWAMIHFYHVPCGKSFRWRRMCCHKTAKNEYINSRAQFAMMVDKNCLVAIEIKDLPDKLRKLLIDNERKKLNDKQPPAPFGWKYAETKTLTQKELAHKEKMRFIKQFGERKFHRL